MRTPATTTYRESTYYYLLFYLSLIKTMMMKLSTTTHSLITQLPSSAIKKNNGRLMYDLVHRLHSGAPFLSFHITAAANLVPKCLPISL